MLSVEQLYVNYGEKEILHDVDLQVAQEEIVMIVGESGSGKSTTGKTFAVQIFTSFARRNYG